MSDPRKILIATFLAFATLVASIAQADDPPTGNGEGTSRTAQASGKGTQPESAGGPARKPDNSDTARGRKGRKGRTAPEPTNAPLVFGTETTRIFSPLGSEGYPDYLAAINNHYRQNATPDNNAVVLLVKAFGPDAIPGDSSEAFFKQLGCGLIPPKGNYFVRCEEMQARWIKGMMTTIDADSDDTLEWQFGIANEQPWSAEQYPMVAHWLELNREPLRLIVEASLRPNYYEPIVSTNASVPTLAMAAAPLEQLSSEIASALEARAMLRAKEGKIEEAWGDLMACHRLLRHMSAAPLGQNGQSARSSEIELCEKELKLLHWTKPDAKQVERMRASFATLPPVTNLAEVIDYGSRYRFLDAVCLLNRRGAKALEQVFAELPFGGEQAAFQQAIADKQFDWNEPLRLGNEWFDKQVVTCRLTDRTKRAEALQALQIDLEEMSREPPSPGLLGRIFQSKKNEQSSLSRRVVGSMLQIFECDVSQALDVADQQAVHAAFLETGVALAAYRSAKGSYPARLDELTPKYIVKLPSDLYSDGNKPLRYHRQASGYFLYSVGPDGLDEAGGESPNYLESDDIAVNISDERQNSEVEPVDGWIR